MKILKSLTILLAGLLLGLALAFSGFFLRNSDPQGDANYFCEKFDEQSLENGKGMTVSFHTTACTTLGTSVATYVYVHPSVEVPSPKFLVLRYSQYGQNNDFLKVQWIDEQHLVLQVEQVSNISKIRSTLGAIAITYRFGRA